MWFFVGQSGALAPTALVCRPDASTYRTLALKMDAAEQKEIAALKAKLAAAEATIARLSSSSSLPGLNALDHANEFEDSRFPLFRKIQSRFASDPEDDLSGHVDGDGDMSVRLGSLETSMQQVLELLQDNGEARLTKPGDMWLPKPKDKPPTAGDSLDTLSAGGDKGPLDISSVEQLFKKYDVDRSGMLDIDEFRTFVQEVNMPGVDLSAVPDFGAMAQGTAKSAEAFASGLAKDTAQSAETLVSDTAKSADDFAKSVLGSVNDLAKGVNNLAASAGVPGATAAVPITLVGGCGSGYKELLAAMAPGSKDVPVEPLVTAIERQATLTTQLGAFMQLIVKLDEGNMRTVRDSWERHGKPASLRELLEAEVAEGVVEPTRLKEGSAALSLLWSMRAKRFWTTVADGFADQDSKEPSSAFGLRAYAAELEPYHGFIFKNTFRPALRALPSRQDMLGNMALMPSGNMGLDTRWEGWERSTVAGEGLTPEERMAACLAELKECSEATKRVTNLVQAQLDELGLRDDRKL